MHIPDNEGKVCDAVVRVLEMRTGEIRTDIRHPEKDGVGPPVDLSGRRRRSAPCSWLSSLWSYP